MLGRRLALTAILMLMLVCDDSQRAQTPRFAVDVTWDGSKSCFDPQSPPFTLSGVPAGLFLPWSVSAQRSASLSMDS